MPGTGVAQRVSSVDSLRAVLVAWIIGGHALLGYAAIGGWAYDEVNEVTFAPAVELVLIAILGPSALFILGTFFLISGLFTPASLAKRGRQSFLTQRTLRLGVPWVASILALWPASLWLAYHAAGRPVGYPWLLVGRERLLDSGALWFAGVLLIFSVAYALLPRRGGASSVVTGRGLLALAVALALVTFVVRLAVTARGTEVLDLHLWQWPQLAAMFWLGIGQARTGFAQWVPPALYRRCGLVVVATLASLPVLALAAGITDVAASAEAFLGGWHWQALLLATIEAVLVVAGSVWLLGFAQRAFTTPGPLARAATRSSFAAFVLQGPVLLALAVAARPLPWPAEVKAPLLLVCGIVGCFALGRLLVTRTPLRSLL
ncbi:hypothetical protein BAY60_15225 [Prauserella muralis]|uniref:Acyltransferase 3 domain-containing protein n=2 Tax=Prauserella muralis TaxID=588067 RepID=A0A2V4B3K9_9PSEU|nr:hypothetical protein BAY60_15225 [Prauserella muralis]